MNGFIGGWQLSGVVTIRSGINYHVLSGQDSENTGNYHRLLNGTRQYRLAGRAFRIPAESRPLDSTRKHSRCRLSARSETFRAMP